MVGFSTVPIGVSGSYDPTEVPPYRIDAHDRALFKQCRRAWDLGARARRNRQPVAGARPPTPGDALAEALAVYYFPGMWDWTRDVVQPLVHQALDRAAAPAQPSPAVHRLLDRYAAWARPRDTFVPIRVAADVEANVPDPLLSDRDLSTYEGGAVRYTARVDAVVWGGDDRLSLVSHRIGTGPFPSHELLALEEPTLTACWAWTHSMLDARLSAIVFNEIRLDDETERAFRRTVVPVSPTEIVLAGRQLGAEVLDMLDAGVSLYPNPTEEGCGGCPFRPPCQAMREGRDAGPILAAGYRARPEPELEEGRLGGQSWSMSRGARPMRFGTERGT